MSLAIVLCYGFLALLFIHLPFLKCVIRPHAPVILTVKFIFYLSQIKFFRTHIRVIMRCIIIDMRMRCIIIDMRGCVVSADDSGVSATQTDGRTVRRLCNSAKTLYNLLRERV